MNLKLISSLGTMIYVSGMECKLTILIIVMCVTKIVIVVVVASCAWKPRL